MAFIYIILYYIDIIVKSFTQTKPMSAVQLLHISIDNKIYYFYPLHLNIDRIVRNLPGFRPKKPPHAHDVYHLVFVTEGTNQVTTGRGCTDCSRGTLLICDPGEMHDFNPLREGIIVFTELTFKFQSLDGETLTIPFRKLLNLYAGVNLKYMRGQSLKEEQGIIELKALFEQIHYWLKSPGVLAPLYTANHVASLFLFIVREYFMLEEPPDPHFSQNLRRAREYIEQNYQRQISIDELVRTARMSKGHFMRSFKKAFGITPVTCLNRTRVNAAKILLVTSALTGSEIASRCGFRDEYYFSKIFRKNTGKPPGGYRKSAKQRKDHP